MTFLFSRGLLEALHDTSPRSARDVPSVPPKRVSNSFGGQMTKRGGPTVKSNRKLGMQLQGECSEL